MSSYNYIFYFFSDHQKPAVCQSPVSASPVNVLGTHGHPENGYDLLFKQFEHTFKDLTVQKQQNADLKKGYEKVRLFVWSDIKQLFLKPLNKFCQNKDKKWTLIKTRNCMN